MHTRNLIDRQQKGHLYVSAAKSAEQPLIDAASPQNLFEGCSNERLCSCCCVLVLAVLVKNFSQRLDDVQQGGFGK